MSVYKTETFHGSMLHGIQVGFKFRFYELCSKHDWRCHSSVKIILLFTRWIINVSPIKIIGVVTFVYKYIIYIHYPTKKSNYYKSQCLRYNANTSTHNSYYKTYPLATAKWERLLKNKESFRIRNTKIVI